MSTPSSRNRNAAMCRVAAPARVALAFALLVGGARHRTSGTGTPSAAHSSVTGRLNSTRAFHGKLRIVGRTERRAEEWRSHNVSLCTESGI